MPSRLAGAACLPLLEILGLVLASLVWFLVVVGFPLDLESLPIRPDEVRHLGFGFKTFPEIRELFAASYPPLTYLFTNAFYMVGGTTPATAFLSVSVVTALIAPASYLLARGLFGRPGGAVAFLLAGTSSLLVAHSNSYLTEQMVALWTPLFLAAWLASKGLTRPWWYGLSGVLLGLGLLSKPTFVFFVFPVFLEGVWRRIWRRGPGSDLSEASGPAGERSGPFGPSGSRGVVAGLALPAGLSVLIWSTLAHGGGWLALLAGEILVLATLVWLTGRPGNRTGMEERRCFGIGIFVLVALALAGPYYAAAGRAVSNLFVNYALWMDFGMNSRWAFDIWGLDAPLIPYETLLVPLGLLGAFRLPRWEWRRPLLVLACLVCGVGCLAAFCLVEGPGNSRFLLPAIPLAAALAGGMPRLLGRLAPLTPVLLATLLLLQYSPDRWSDLRLQKKAPNFLEFLGEAQQSRVPAVLLRRLQAHAFRQGAVCLVPCRSEKAWDEFMAVLGHDRGFWNHVGGFAGLLILEPTELETLARGGLSEGEPELVLLGTRSEQEEASLAREVEGILDVRLERLESLGDRRCRFTVCRIRRGRGNLVTSHLRTPLWGQKGGTLTILSALPAGPRPSRPCPPGSPRSGPGRFRRAARGSGARPGR